MLLKLLCTSKNIFSGMSGARVDAGVVVVVVVVVVEVGAVVVVVVVGCLGE